MERYPNVPGWKDRDTARAAAEAIAPRAKTIRDQVLKLYTAGNEMTADEAASVLELSILTVRPRVTELNRLGKIDDSGVRRLNDSGRPAIVWKCV